MKVSRANLRIIVLAVLLSLPYVVATPVYSFWFFKHKNNHQGSQNYKSDSQTNYAYQYPISQTGSVNRLVPSYLINKVPSGQTSRIESVEAKKDHDVQSVKEKQNIEYKSILNTIPTTPLFNYNKTNIRVAIGLNLQSAKLAILDGAILVDNASNKIIANLPAQSQWILFAQNNHLALKPDREFYIALQQLANAYSLSSISNGKTIPTSYTSYIGLAAIATADKKFGSAQMQQRHIDGLPLPINGSGYTIKAIVNQQTQAGLLALNNRLYHGDFLIKPSAQPMPSYNVINCLDLEDYLLSVVPSEMPSLWPLEALKAQTIAARSYALANLGKHGSAGYDLKDNIEDQVYLGVKAETDSSNEAVNSTRGLVMKYDGKPICAYFHSCSGGSTERAEHVWHSAVPYLKAVIDFDQEAPLYNWTKNYSIWQTESGLPKDIGQVLSITILAKAPSGRATYILVNGSNNSRIISGEAARKYFNLPSTNFNVTSSEAAYIFAGKGFGHGLGLSQWGAKSLAKYGYNAAQILCYYYDGISIDY